MKTTEFAAPHAYLTHPQVRIDAAVPVPQWGLRDEGRTRTRALAETAFMRRFTRIVSSGETKALETAAILAANHGLPVFVRDAMHENDRSATGFLPPAEFETVADAFFAQPERSIRGWERAIDAQARVLSEVAAVLEGDDRPTLFVGHGAVGTLLLCHLAGRPIQRVDGLRTNRFRVGDQPPGGGNVYTFTWVPRAAQSSWVPMEDCA